MPLLAIASAIARTSASVTRPANLFQLFQPMAGVRAIPLSRTRCRAGGGIFAGIAPSPGGTRYATSSGCGRAGVAATLAADALVTAGVGVAGVPGAGRRIA